MNAPVTSPQSDWTLADLFERFGAIPHRRVRQDPAPGTATEEDVARIHDRENRLYELVDGVLLEKAMGVWESFLAMRLGWFLNNVPAVQEKGFVLGADGMARLAPGLIRIPDLSFISWRQVPDHKIPDEPRLGFGPELAVEILSPSNTAREMEEKLHDYFAAGVRLVWYIDAQQRTVRVYTSPDQSRLLRETDILTGEPVLPELSLPLREFFAPLGS